MPPFNASIQQPTQQFESNDKFNGLRQLLYTPIEEAIPLLDSRKKQSHLKLPDFDIPAQLQPDSKWAYKLPHTHTAAIIRHIGTPNHEMHRVMALCEQYQLNLLIMSFQEDKFSPNNACKYALGRMGFFEGLGRQGGKKIRYSTIMDFNRYNGRPLRECRTFRGQPFLDFHHELLFQTFPQLGSDNLFECSEWFIHLRNESGNFYQTMLKLFLKHAILFETFVLSGSELDFTLKKVLPVFQEIIDDFGIKPLIVQSDDPATEGDDYWQLYPEHLHEFAPYERRKTVR